MGRENIIHVGSLEFHRGFHICRTRLMLRVRAFAKSAFFRFPLLLRIPIQIWKTLLFSEAGNFWQRLRGKWVQYTCMDQINFHFSLPKTQKMWKLKGTFGAQNFSEFCLVQSRSTWMLYIKSQTCLLLLTKHRNGIVLFRIACSFFLEKLRFLSQCRRFQEFPTAEEEEFLISNPKGNLRNETTKKKKNHFLQTHGHAT